MIYLIDDNLRNQQQEYNAGYLGSGTYQNLITPHYTMTVNSDFDQFKAADCLLLHDSFPEFDAGGQVVHGSAKIVTKIVSVATEKNIPLVRFSNSYIGLEESVFNDKGLSGINKWLFYQNLEHFIHHFRDQNSIEIKILAYGPHFVYKEMQLLYHQIAQDLQANYLESSRTDLTPKLQKFGDLCNSSENIQKRFDEGTGPELLLFLDKVIKSVIRYGRNIYN